MAPPPPPLPSLKLLLLLLGIQRAGIIQREEEAIRPIYRPLGDFIG
jgi:hypothetical protein